MALAVKGGDLLMEQTKAGSLLVDRAEDVAYLKAPTPATFLHHAVSQPCCRLWSCVLVMVPSCGQIQALAFRTETQRC